MSGVPAVPSFDPYEAGTDGRVLLLLKDVAASGPPCSGFVSPGSDHNPAETIRRAKRHAPVDRDREVVTWNIILPWYRGSRRGRKHPGRGARRGPAGPGRALPRLGTVVPLGHDARLGWKRAGKLVPAALHKHPSPNQAARMNGLTKRTAIAGAVAAGGEHT